MTLYKFTEMMIIALAALRIAVIEKVCKDGLEASRENVEKMRDVYCEIVHFWKLDKELIADFEQKIEELERMDREGLK
jgi:hypothetical protein